MMVGVIGRRHLELAGVAFLTPLRYVLKGVKKATTHLCTVYIKQYFHTIMCILPPLVLSGCIKYTPYMYTS